MRHSLLLGFFAALTTVGVVLAEGGSAIPPEVRKGTVAPGTPPCRWGAVCRDETNGQFLWFGGTGGRSKQGALATWIYKDGKWRRPTFGTPEERALAAQVNALRLQARDLYAAVANRYYRSETGSESERDLSAAYRKLAEKMGAVEVPGGSARGLLVDARKRLAAPANKLADFPTVREVAAAREAMMALVKLAWTVAPEPPPRYRPALAYDARTKSIVPFGGEGIYGAMNDTWLYDCLERRWRLVEPPTAPGPRSGAGMVCFQGKAYLVGGFAPRGSMSYEAALWYRLPMEVWAFDIEKERWVLLDKGEGKPRPTHAQPPVEVTLSPDGRRLSWKADVIAWGRKRGEITGSLDLGTAGAGDDKAGVSPGTLLVRGVGFDPAWYEDVPPPDLEAVADKLRSLPPNKWMAMNPPRLHVRRDWGTTVLDASRDQLLHWGGGHCTHCGTDVAHYSIPLNRWHILYPPELPFECCYAAGVPVPSITGRPWAPHAYLSYAVDALTGLMLWTGRAGAYRMTNPGGSFLYNPARYEWSVVRMEMVGGRFDPERHKTCMVPTPQGIAVWACKRGGCGGPSGIWLADIRSKTYRPLAATDPKDKTTLPPSRFGDVHGVTYGSKRNRLLLFHFGIKEKHRVWAVDLASGKVTVREPKGSDAFPADATMAREATYIPEADLVVICSRGKPRQHTLIYDCAANAWLEMFSACSKPDKRGRTQPPYGVSTGIEWDSKRKLLWLVDTFGRVYVMRFERASADIRPLSGGRDAAERRKQ